MSQPPVTPKSNATTRFLSRHITTYGLKVSARHPSSGQVYNCVCHFCIVFGREKKVGGKRDRTRNIKYFKTFHTDGYRRHLSTAHAYMWDAYQDLETKDENKQFFKSRSDFVNSLDAHLESSPHIQIIVNAPMIEKVVWEILFHPDDVDGVTRKHALNLFKKLEEPSGSDEVGQYDVYGVVIKTRSWFEICIKFVLCGASFHMSSRLMDCTHT